MSRLLYILHKEFDSDTVDLFSIFLTFIYTEQIWDDSNILRGTV